MAEQSSLRKQKDKEKLSARKQQLHCLKTNQGSPDKGLYKGYGEDEEGTIKNKLTVNKMIRNLL